MDFVKSEIEKSKRINGLLDEIKTSKDILSEFGIEIRVYKNGVELKS